MKEDKKEQFLRFELAERTTVRITRTGLAIAFFGGLLVAACSCQTLQQKKVDAVAQQAIADKMWELILRHQEIPEHLREAKPVKNGTEFDVSEYFTILKHLSMRPGYVLDYAYFYMDHHPGWAFPYTYGRRVNEPLCTDFNELVERDRIRYGNDSIILHAQTDGSAQGFWELFVLMELGNRFYHKYHDLRGRKVPIFCTREALERFLANDKNFEGVDESVDEWDSNGETWAEKVRKIQLEPVIVMGKRSVTVKAVGHVRTKGFVRIEWTVTRVPPHRSVQLKLIELVGDPLGAALH